MYAARRYPVKNWTFLPAEERETVQVMRGGKPNWISLDNTITSVEEQVMSWRKANQIHAWFVKNVQGGIDNCGTYHVSFEHLDELARACADVMTASELVDGQVYAGTVYDRDHPEGIEQRTPGKVIKDNTVAKALLPTQAGCFFGSTEYDQFYLEDVMDTQKWAARMLADREAGNPGDIYYSSSW